MQGYSRYARVAEKVIWHILGDLHKKTQAKNLVVAGEFFMNSVINGKITKNTPFQMFMYHIHQTIWEIALVRRYSKSLYFRKSTGCG